LIPKVIFLEVGEKNGDEKPYVDGEIRPRRMNKNGTVQYQEQLVDDAGTGMMNGGWVYR
jgi:hypothetical protein